MTADAIRSIVSQTARSTRDLTPEQNERLRPLVQRLLNEVGTQVKLGELIGMKQSTISGFLKGKRQGTSFAVARKVCELSGVDIASVLGPSQLPMSFTVASLEAPGSEMPVGPFLMKLRRMPGLETWVEANPTKLTVSQLAAGMAIYDEVKPASRSDGQPLNGWDGFFDDALAGRLTRSSPGAQDAAEAAERRQMSPAARKRLRSASKK